MSPLPPSRPGAIITRSREGRCQETLQRPRFVKTEAIVLKYSNMGEADRLITFFTPNHGKLRAVAKGIRKARSRRAGHLEPLNTCQILVHRGQSLDTVSQCETVAATGDLRQDLWRVACGMYLAELADHFTQEEQENFRLYRLLRESLDALAGAGNPDLLLRYFELHLLDLTGYNPELYQCIECRVPVAPTANYFSPSAGGVLCPGCRYKHPSHRPLSLNTLKVMRFLSRSDFPEASTVRLPEELAVELEGVIRQYIHYVLDSEVHSTKFLDLLRREHSAQKMAVPDV